MQIDDELITHLENISLLTLSDGEKIRFKAELQEILDNMELFKKFNPQNGRDREIAECSSPLDNVNVFRNDEVQPSFARELILKNAPAKNDEMFIAPKTAE